VLILTRKEQESIVIQSDKKTIEVTVTSIRDGRVLLGIDAPSDVKITRKELIDDRNRTTTTTTTDRI